MVHALIVHLHQYGCALSGREPVIGPWSFLTLVDFTPLHTYSSKRFQKPHLFKYGTRCDDLQSAKLGTVLTPLIEKRGNTAFVRTLDMV